jgi:TPP-dependent 2-oxoacid decarboxylase
LRNEIVLVLGESTSLYVFGNLFGLPRNGFVAEAAWGSLGRETGCALGVALGSGKRPPVIAGDGGFMMICQELSSLVRQRCNAVVFVMSNKGYAIEQAFVDINAFKPNGTFAPFDVLPTWDYLALAKSFGFERLSGQNGERSSGRARKGEGSPGRARARRSGDPREGSRTAVETAGRAASCSAQVRQDTAQGKKVVGGTELLLPTPFAD